MPTIDELLDMSVKDQRGELKNLDRNKLKKLRNEEDRNTALEHIDRQLSRTSSEQEDESDNRTDAQEEDSEQENSEETDSVTPQDPSDEMSAEERIRLLERRVDYLIKRCKTTSEDAFRDYEA